MRLARRRASRVDGEVRRRRCRITDLEPTGERILVRDGMSKDEVLEALRALAS